MPSGHKLVDIRYVVSQGINVFHTPAKTRQDQLYVLEYLFYLDFNIALSNNIASHVERDLPFQVNDLSRALHYGLGKCAERHPDIVGIKTVY